MPRTGRILGMVHTDVGGRNAAAACNSILAWSSLNRCTCPSSYIGRWSLRWVLVLYLEKGCSHGTLRLERIFVLFLLKHLFPGTKRHLPGLRSAPAELERWDRWDIGTTSAAAAEKLAAAGLPADIVVCLGPHEETAAWCTAGHPKAARIVAVSRSFVEFITIEKLAALRLGNLICLDEIHDMYPFVGEKWDGTENDAKVLMAIVLQMSRTFPVAPSSRSMRGLRIESELVRPQPLWLVTQYYKPDQSKRRQRD